MAEVTGKDTPAGAATPWFARVAAGLLESGDAATALQVCTVGTRAFPRYATGRLILGRCFDALGRHVEAMIEYRQVIEVFPDNPVVGTLVMNAEAREQEGFEQFAEAQRARLQKGKETLTFDEFLGTVSDSSRSTSVERILQQLEDAPRRIHPRDDAQSPPEAVEPGTGGNRLVTATLAEIYASQGAYEEAIAAYRKLAVQQPGSAERYEKRLHELEELQRSRQDNA
jgi:tetratricopeptide (TPR) repeat protein